MEDPRNSPGIDDPAKLISPVEMMQSPEGTAFGFSLLDEESMTPCFRLAFETREDAEQGRSLLAEIIEHCMYFEVVDAPEPSEPNQPPPSRWR